MYFEVDFDEGGIWDTEEDMELITKLLGILVGKYTKLTWGFHLQ